MFAKLMQKTPSADKAAKAGMDLSLDLSVMSQDQSVVSTSDAEDQMTAYTLEEVARHSSRKDLWLIIDKKVYDVTNFDKEHPGGAAALLQFAGRDATEAAAIAHDGLALPGEKMKEMLIGRVYTSEGGAKATVSEATDKKGGAIAFKSPASSCATTPRRDAGGAIDLSGGGLSPRSQVGDAPVKVSTNTVPPAPPPLSALPPAPPPPSGGGPSGGQQQRGGSARDDEEPGEESSEANEDEAEEEEGNGLDCEHFEELHIPEEDVKEMREVWIILVKAAGSEEAAGDAVYASLFDGAPSLQNLFQTPRAVQGMRFVLSIGSLLDLLDKPKVLKNVVETVGFGHLNLEVTPDRAVVFRDLIMELFEIELGAALTPGAKRGWKALLSYVAGAIVFVRTKFTDRLSVLNTSWKKCSSVQQADAAKAQARAQNNVDDGQRSPTAEGDDTSADGLDAASPVTQKSDARPSLWTRTWRRFRKDSSRSVSDDQLDNVMSSPRHEGTSLDVFSQTVVRTFQAMFEFNAAVMGFGNSRWLREVVACFHNMVVNVSNSRRLQEECDVVVLRIRKVHKGEVRLSEYKSCMLATLRSLLPKDWDSNHELAWNWLWDNVERMMTNSLTKAMDWERLLSNLLESIDEKQAFWMRKEIYDRFFKMSAEGQNVFKQSDTRLHYIAEQIIRMTRDIFHDPHRMVDDLSALGLRHAGYGIAIDHFGPFVSCCVQVMGAVTEDREALAAFRWSLGLITMILTRTIGEGSTIVMKAINANSVPQLRKALGAAPRGARATWPLKVEVGTQSISPLMWSIGSGRLEAADAMIQDILAIRADRDRYYYGVDELFGRHYDIIQKLCNDAPALLNTLLDGLIWRSRIASNGHRRVNYYVKHLLITPEGTVSDTLSWLVAAKDPKSMTHPVIVTISDTLWTGLVARQFILSKVWFIGSLLVFMLSQAILPKSDNAGDLGMRVAIFIGRMFNYIVTMCRLLHYHAKHSLHAYRQGDTVKFMHLVKVPRYLKDPTDFAGFFLSLFVLLMCTHEPLFWCLGSEDGFEEFPSERCHGADAVRFRYSVFCMAAMAIHWLMLIDLAVFSTGLSAFVLVIGQVLSEMTRFLAALIFLLMTFGCGISVLEHPYFEMRDIPNSAIALFSITVRLYEDDYRNMLGEPALLAAVFIFVTFSAVVLLNLLIAQINCSYVYIYQDMVGFARLNRAKVIVETLEECPEATWTRFVESLGLDEPLEFNEGDIGLAGGMQVLEPASAHVVLEDRIMRFGGSCAEDMPWPAEHGHHKEAENHYDKIERLLGKVLDKLGKGKRRRRMGVNGSLGQTGDGSRDTSSGFDEDSVIS